MKSHRNHFSTVINTVIATTAALLMFSLVALGQTSTVVTNSSSNPVQVRDVDAAKRQPLQETAVLSMARGDYAEDLPITFSRLAFAASISARSLSVIPFSLSSIRPWRPLSCDQPP